MKLFTRRKNHRVRKQEEKKNQINKEAEIEIIIMN